MCKRFSVEKFYKFGSDWAYLHLIDRSVQVQKQLSTVDLKESCNELKIKILEEEVKTLKSQIGQLATLYTEVSDKLEEITKDKVNAESTAKNTPVKISKHKCNMCEYTCKKEVTLRKHRNAKHGHTSLYKNKDLGKGEFGFVFDVRPGKEKEAEDMRLEWKKEKRNEDNTKKDCRDLSDIDEETNREGSDLDSNKKDQTDESEDDDAFLAKYDDDGNYIG